MTQNKYQELFISTFKISACTFGGGFVIIPLLRKKFVEELGWIKEEEMLDLAAIAQSSPGAIAVNASIIVGYHVAGIKGALVCILGTILPPLIIISIISLFYNAFCENIIVKTLMKGMLCGVAAILFDVVISMSSIIFKKKQIVPIIIMFGSFVALRFFNVNIILIIIVCGLVGILHGKKEKVNDSI